MNIPGASQGDSRINLGDIVGKVGDAFKSFKDVGFVKDAREMVPSKEVVQEKLESVPTEAKRMWKVIKNDPNVNSASKTVKTSAQLHLYPAAAKALRFLGNKIHQVGSKMTSDVISKEVKLKGVQLEIRADKLKERSMEAHASKEIDKMGLKPQDKQQLLNDCRSDIKRHIKTDKPMTEFQQSVKGHIVDYYFNEALKSVGSNNFYGTASESSARMNKFKGDLTTQMGHLKQLDLHERTPQELKALVEAYKKSCLTNALLYKPNQTRRNGM